MTRKLVSTAVLTISAFAAGLLVAGHVRLFDTAQAQSGTRVFELRTYTTLPGRLDALHARFADHTIGLFEKHGMTSIGYFTPREEPLSANTLIYVLAHDSREAADASWLAFAADPEWQRVAEASQRDGKILEGVERIYMNATAYSQLQ